MLVRAPAPLPHRLQLLAKLAMGEAGPTGPVADKARHEALKLAKDPASREQLQGSPQTMDLLKILLAHAA
jgi:hypothetical protein